MTSSAIRPNAGHDAKQIIAYDHCCMSRTRWCGCAVGWGYHVDLEFEPGESFVTLGGGDLAALSYGAYSNHLVLKPKAPAIHTNLTYSPTKRTYVIDYAVSGEQARPASR